MKVMDNKKRVNSFGMNRFISNHLFKPEEVVDPNAETPSVKEPAKKKAKKKSSEGGARGGFTKPYELSEDLQKVVKSALLPRTQVVKKIWEYIKEKSLQDPQDGRFIICDENLFNLFGKKRVSSFEMNKYISKHLYPASSDNTTVPEDSNPGTPAEAAKSEVLDDDSVDDE
jgi:upstream activation factor subunit UAF30